MRSRNRSEIGEGKKRKHMQRKMMKKAAQAQERTISSRGVLLKNGVGEQNCC
jgi:hypothetical protein